MAAAAMEERDDLCLAPVSSGVPTKGARQGIMLLLKYGGKGGGGDRQHMI